MITSLLTCVGCFLFPTCACVMAAFDDDDGSSPLNFSIREGSGCFLDDNEGEGAWSFVDSVVNNITVADDWKRYFSSDEEEEEEKPVRYVAKPSSPLTEAADKCSIISGGSKYLRGVIVWVEWVVFKGKNNAKLTTHFIELESFRQLDKSEGYVHPHVVKNVIHYVSTVVDSYRQPDIYCWLVGFRSRCSELFNPVHLIRQGDTVYNTVTVQGYFNDKRDCAEYKENCMRYYDEWIGSTGVLNKSSPILLCHPLSTQTKPFMGRLKEADPNRPPSPDFLEADGPMEEVSVVEPSPYGPDSTRSLNRRVSKKPQKYVEEENKKY